MTLAHLRQRSRGESHDSPLFRRRAGQSPMELNVTLPKEHDNRTPPMGAKLPNFRWLQLSIGIVCMVMIANLQYGWTLFVNPLDQKFHWGRPTIQVAFTIFVLAESWLLPICGWLVDKRGPRQLTFIAGLMIGASWMFNSVASAVWEFYLSSAIGGLGVGDIVAAAIGNALKWFPNRRG